ncbi:MAG: T9SS type A sorting domain-containing protein [Bacteroidota bacterium]
MKKIYTLITAMTFAAGLIAQNSASGSADADVVSGTTSATENKQEQSVDHIKPISPVVNTQAVLVDNGPLVTHPGQGSGGADVSALISPLTSFGYNNSFSTLRMIADNFTVSGTWDVDSLIFFNYQTGSSTTSTLNGLYVAIYNGNPMSGGQIVWGDTVTDVFDGTYWSGIYRAQDVDLLNTQRPIMKVYHAPVTCNLSAGTYWVAWRTSGSLASGPWVPPITYTSQTTTGDGLQYTGGTWVSVADGTTGDQQGFPFILKGTMTGIEESPFIKTFALYPNPATTALTVQLTTSSEIKVSDLSFVVYDMLGNEVSRTNGLSNTFTFDCTSLSSGMYIYKIVDGGNTALKSGKFSVQ